MKIEIEVNIGLKPAAERFLSALLASAGSPAVTVAHEDTRAPAERGLEVENHASRGGADTVSEQEPEPEQEKAPAEEKASAYPTDDDLRTMMDVAIARFCGTGWRDDTDPAKVRLRKSCTRAFREMSRHFGADKPTKIVPEKRAEFLKELDNMLLNPEQTEVCWTPF